MSTPFDHIPSCSRTADYTKPTATASRVAQVELFLANACEGCDDGMEHAAALEDECRTLAAEVDELRCKLDDVRMGIGCARGQRTTQFCAEAAARDEVIGRLLAMLKPGSGQLGRIEDDKTISLTIAEWNLLVTAHERACEIAGRTE